MNYTTGTMNCTTGLDIFSYIPMRYLQHMACKTFLDLSKELADSPFIPYQKEVCVIATEHIDSTFNEFRAAFCKTASAAVKATAQLIDQDLKNRMAQMGFIAAVGTIGCVYGANLARKNGYTNASKILVICGLFTGMYSIGSTYVSMNS